MKERKFRREGRKEGEGGKEGEKKRKGRRSRIHYTVSHFSENDFKELSNSQD